MRDDMVKDSASPLVKPNVYLQGNYLMQSRSSKIVLYRPCCTGVVLGRSTSTRNGVEDDQLNDA